MFEIGILIWLSQLIMSTWILLFLLLVLHIWVYVIEVGILFWVHVLTLHFINILCLTFHRQLSLACISSWQLERNLTRITTTSLLFTLVRQRLKLGDLFGSSLLIWAKIWPRTNSKISNLPPLSQLGLFWRQNWLICLVWFKMLICVRIVRHVQRILTLLNFLLLVIVIQMM